jgi:type II secretory pathway component GspD/PulD (secretin)
MTSQALTTLRFRTKPLSTKPALAILALASALLFLTLAASAQAPAADEKPGPISTQTFYLNNISQQSEATELVTALRNSVDPHDKIFLVLSQNAIVVQAPPDQLKLVQQLLHDLDRPRKTYRLTYTITEADSGKRIGVQHFSMVVVSGQRTTLKQGSKVPIVTGSYSLSSNGSENQVSYLDIGLNFDSTLDESANGVRLRSAVEQSAIAEEKSGVGPQDPVVRQTKLEGTSFLTAGKPLMLGSIDIPGSTRHLDIEVAMEQVAH